MSNKLNNNNLENVNGGFHYDGDYSLSYGDCFIDSSGQLRYMVIEDYEKIEAGTHISIKCFESPFITYMNFGTLMECTYVGKYVFNDADSK